MAKPKQKLGALVDRLWSMREDIRAEEARLKKHKAEFNTLREKVMQDYDKAEVAKAAGARGQASLSPRHFYRVKDQHLFLDAVRKKKAWHLLKAGLNTEEFDTMLEDRKDKGLMVINGKDGKPQTVRIPNPFPGVELFTEIRLHLTSVKKGRGQHSRPEEDDE